MECISHSYKNNLSSSQRSKIKVLSDQLLQITRNVETDKVIFCGQLFRKTDTEFPISS